MRQVNLFKIQLKVAPIADFHGICHCLRQLSEQGLHLIRRLKIKLVCLQPHPVRVIKHCLGLYTQKRLMSIGVLLFKIVHVVGAHKAQAQLLGNLNNIFAYLFLLRQGIIHYLYVEILRRQYVPEFACGFYGIIHIVV